MNRIVFLVQLKIGPSNKLFSELFLHKVFAEGGAFGIEGRWFRVWENTHHEKFFFMCVEGEEKNITETLKNKFFIKKNAITFAKPISKNTRFDFSVEVAAGKESKRIHSISAKCKCGKKIITQLLFVNSFDGTIVCDHCCSVWKIPQDIFSKIKIKLNQSQLGPSGLGY